MIVSFKDQIDEIKSNINIIDEISKHIKIITKGNDTWCLCFFHNEKTPSMKINDEKNSYYCFGCGAKGDIISFYTDYLKYSFNDALKELANKAGVKLSYNKNFEENNSKKITQDILEATTNWFHKNLFLKENESVLFYLKKRKITKETILNFKLGYSSNKKIKLLDYLKSISFKEEDIAKSNLFKITENNKFKEFLYNRLIFPIYNEYNKTVGYGGRSIDNTNPKYINSSESIFFKKGRTLYNLEKAKIFSRKKNNLLICEGYMDVISLSNKNINSVVAPLGTAMTPEQLKLSWKYCKKPTIMFDSDKAGKKASIKVALLSLKYLKPEYSLKFIELPDNEDPDSYINNSTSDEFKELLKKSKNLSDFIFDYAKNSFEYSSADQKIIFDKYFDDITNVIEDKRIRYFYKKDFKEKLFDFFSKNNKFFNKDNSNLKINASNLNHMELYSIIAAYINHQKIRIELIEDITNFDFKNADLNKSFREISKKENINLGAEEIIKSISDNSIKEIVKKSLSHSIYTLFPYSSASYSHKSALKDVKKTLKMINRKLSNSSELDKRLKDFNPNSSNINWDELKNLSYDYISEIDL